MYVVDALRLLLRRWLVVLIGGAATAGACYAALTYVDTEYQASSQMLFILPPEASGPSTPTNPYLNLQDGLTTTASLVAGTISTKDVERQLAGAGDDATYTVTLVPGAGPLLLITANDTDPGVAISTRDEVMRRVDVELARLQEEASVPARQLMTATRTSVSENAEVLPGRRLRAVAGAAAAGMLLTLLLAFVVDRLANRRRIRRAAATQADEVVGDAAGEPDPPEPVVAEPEPEPEPEPAPEPDRRPVAVGSAPRNRPSSPRRRSPAKVVDDDSQQAQAG